ncbi:hypothetical protein G9P44_005126 [Scheffersomyces stipitis]|nr:hypothetical protein G9P44_005126 [Scheffersomyces stipitis]
MARKYAKLATIALQGKQYRQSNCPSTLQKFGSGSGVKFRPQDKEEFMRFGSPTFDSKLWAYVVN